MKYLTDRILKIIDLNMPEKDGETIILINGFSELSFYSSLAELIFKKFNEDDKRVGIKLAGKKWKELKNSSNTTEIQFMEHHSFIADNESVTYYRNLHKYPVLILMGTEDEDDIGGLKNCYTITPETLRNELEGHYYRLFEDCFTYVTSEDDKKLIDKMYNCLFDFAAPDICKLSKFAEQWQNSFDTFDEFIIAFSQNLPDWGLPPRILNPITRKFVDKKSNFLLDEHHFINFKLFNRFSESSFANFEKTLSEYDNDGGKYSSSWDGWRQQGFNDYNDYCNTVKEYYKGRNIPENKKRLLKADYSIINDIISKKTKKDRKKELLDKEIQVNGEPLKAFLFSFYKILEKASKSPVEIKAVEFEFKSAEIVTGFTDIGNDDDKEARLNLLWKNICIHVNSIFDFIGNCDWSVKGKEFSIVCASDNFFDIKKVNDNIDQGIVSTVSKTNTLNKIRFSVRCLDNDGDLISYELGDEEINLEHKFCWSFRNESGWLYDFSDITRQDFVNNDEGYIPIVKFNNIFETMFVKSNEEFFDIIEDSKLDYTFNLMDFINLRLKNIDPKYKFRFEDLAKKFTAFINLISEHGFYKCFDSSHTEYSDFILTYNKLAEELLSKSLPENALWLLDSFIHAFNFELNTDFLKEEEEPECSIVPPWHPATLQKLFDQKRFILECIYEAWKAADASNKKFNFSEMIDELFRTAEIQSSVDLFPARQGRLFGCLGSYGSYSVYGDYDIKHQIKTRIKDLIKKEAIYDEEFSKKEMMYMSDDAQMIYDLLNDYVTAIPYAKYSMRLVFVNPSDLQPIIAAVYRYIEMLRKANPTKFINIRLMILVKPENKGGRNYLAYWMNDYFETDSYCKIRAYLNEWKGVQDLKNLLISNNDIIFNMDLLTANEYSFCQCNEVICDKIVDCRFPIVYRPAPVSRTSRKRRIELSQPQFSASFNHTQIVHFRKHAEESPNGKTYLAVKESNFDKDAQQYIDLFHQNSYWVVCIDKVMDGALLRNDENSDFSIIGFSTGKGIYGQYNLTITARNSILETVQNKLKSRLRSLFHWNEDLISSAVDSVLKEYSSLDGVSLFSAVNPADYKINEFMAYVLTSMREKINGSQSPLRILVHLDSYQHWFKNAEDSSSRPDFLMLSVKSFDDILHLEARVIECKISSISNSHVHKEKALEQVLHGLKHLQLLFNPDSSSKDRRYWYAQLYRALVFAQVSFSNDSDKFDELSKKLRSILNGNFSIEWKGEVLGYWFDMQGLEEKVDFQDGVSIFNIPQLKIQEILSGEPRTDFVTIRPEFIESSCESDDSLEGSSSVDTTDIADNGSSTLRDTIAEDETLVLPSQGNSSSNLDNTLSSESNSSDNHISSSSDANTHNDSLTGFQGLSDTRILIGSSRTNTPLFWEFGNSQLANRHLLITGTSGQGKTYCIQTLLYELSKSGVSAVVFDYTEGFREDQLDQFFRDNMSGKFEQHVIYSEGMLINPFKRHVIDLAGEVVQEKSFQVASRIADIFAHVYKFGDQQVSDIYQATLNGMDKYGDGMNMSHFQNELSALNSKTSKTVVSKLIPFFHSIEFHTSDVNWNNIIYGENGKLTIFQLTNYSREMQVVITEFLLWDLWYFATVNGSKDKPFVVVLDEAQNLSHKADSPSGKILTEGRKFGWSAWYATQSLNVLNGDEVTRLMQAAFKLYFKPADNEINSMSKQLNPSDPSEWRNSLISLKKGQCIVTGSRTQNNGRFESGRPLTVTVSSFGERS